MDKFESDELEEKEQNQQVSSKSKIYTVKEFQRRVLDGEITDDKGVAQVLINGAPTTINVYIDRHCATRGDGSLITYAGFIKQYDLDTVSVLYTLKPRRKLF